MSTPAKTKNVNKIIIIIIVIIMIAAAAFAGLYFAGLIGGGGTEVGDYKIIVDQSVWSTSIGQDSQTLVLMDKTGEASGIGILPYGSEITYEMVSDKETVKKLFAQMDNVKLENQSERTIEGIKCNVVNIKYTNAVMASDKAIKAFCNSKDNVVFLLEIEAPSQSGLESNLIEGVKMINSAQHK